MKRWLLATAVLLGGSLFPAHADYVVIIANLGNLDGPAPPPGPDGPMGPGGPGGPGVQQGGGVFGGPATPPAPPPPPPPGGIDPDIVPYWATVVVEVDKISAVNAKNFFKGQPIQVAGPWGKATLAPTLGFRGEVKTMIVSAGDKGTLTEKLEQLKAKAYPKGSKEKPDSENVLALADWCLKHGSLSHFEETMDQFAKDDSKHPAVIAYLRVKAELAKPVKNPAPTATYLRLVEKYKSLAPANEHYIAYYNKRDEPPQVVSRLKKLEHNFKSFYYWFALRGIVLPLPTERLPAIVTFDAAEFKKLNEVLAPSLTVADGFVARREDLVVLSAKRLDWTYESLEKYTTPYWSQGINRNEILTKPEAVPVAMTGGPVGKASLQALALLMKTMEQDTERESCTHNGTRQLLYASGLLQRNVSAPEWLQFGLSSFFETPSGSPWMSTGAASTEYLPLFLNLKHAKRLGKPPAETLRMIVTDGYFRQAKMDGEHGSRRRAEATSWALMFFLGQGTKLEGQKPYLDGLQKYCKELAKMPRDLELDDEALMHLFCKSFGLLDGSDKIDAQKFDKLADKFATAWDTYLEQEQLELKEVVEIIRVITAAFAPTLPEGDKAAPGGQLVATEHGGPYHPALDEANGGQANPMPGDRPPLPFGPGPGIGPGPGKGPRPNPGPGPVRPPRRPGG